MANKLVSRIDGDWTGQESVKVAITTGIAWDTNQGDEGGPLTDSNIKFNVSTPPLPM